MFLLHDLFFVLCSLDLDVLRAQRIMGFFIILYRVQTWCPGSVLGHGHQCELSILVVPI